MVNNGIFGTPYGFKVGSPTVNFVAGGAFKEKRLAENARAGFIRHGAKATRIEYIGGDYIVYFQPGSKQKRQMKKGPNGIYVDRPF